MTVDTADHLRCQDLVHRLWNALDHRRLDEVISYLTADARWQRERWYEGVDDIRAALEARPADMTIRHLLTNMIVDAHGSGFEARMLMMPHRATVKEGARPPFKAEPLGVLADLTVKIAKVGESLKVSEISFKGILRPGAT